VFFSTQWSFRPCAGYLVRRFPPLAVTAPLCFRLFSNCLFALLLPAVGVGAVALLMSKDIRQSSAMLRRNMRHVRTWLEEQGAAAE
jgi:hypothetical protein